MDSSPALHINPPDSTKRMRMMLKGNIGMDNYDNFPDARIDRSGAISKEFLRLGVTGFMDACRYVQQLPYGYNSDRDDLLILFREEN